MPQFSEFSFSFCDEIGGHDDSKLLVPATVILRNMFAPAELRVTRLFKCLDAAVLF